MSIFIFLSASALAVPAVDERRGKVLRRFYPEWARIANAQTSARLELVVLPDGTVSNCRLIEAVGSSRLAAEACAAIAGSKIIPAQDAQGAPSFAIFHYQIRYTANGGTDKLVDFETTPDIQLVVNKLPEDVIQLNFQILLMISKDGTPTNCQLSSAIRNPPPETYIHLACDQAKKVQGTILRDSTGAMVPYVTDFSVRFSRTGK